MADKKQLKKGVIMAPLSGKIVPLSEVPDEVFAQKVIGDGIAIEPIDGKVYSPVSGVITQIADTKHAYGIKSEDGVEILIHFGLETVALNGEGFDVKVKVGDKVKAGTLIAIVDMDFMLKKGINTITPVLVCDGAENKTLECMVG